MGTIYNTVVSLVNKMVNKVVNINDLVRIHEYTSAWDAFEREDPDHQPVVCESELPIIDCETGEQVKKYVLITCPELHKYDTTDYEEGIDYEPIFDFIHNNDGIFDKSLGIGWGLFPDKKYKVNDITFTLNKDWDRYDDEVFIVIED